MCITNMLDLPDSFYKAMEPCEYYNMLYKEDLNKVMKWADNNPSFDPTFVISLQKRLVSGKDLTQAQEEALENIIKKFKIYIKEV